MGPVWPVPDNSELMCDKHRAHTYRVIWSAADGEPVGRCAEFP